ncbi:amidohydrolase [Streptomyces sp. Ru73]|uniref:amidohydrolase family protein n=1 Tax=Streptomyces sp. Ru73 TaxID=2080748 RepID=UPI000CDE435F|nr:amidohydrolase family protein [Streptomyces sp. Ru73]POX42247.1 amidohydrolase [Streptomyces sp. Ru73]
MIDAHHHLWDPAVRAYPWLDPAAHAPIHRRYAPADLRRHAAAHGVTGTVLVQTVATAEETADFLAAARASDGLIAGVVGWADLTAPELDLPDDPLLVGLRHQAEDEPDPSWLLRADVRRSLAALGARGLAYDLLVRAPQRQAALACVRGLDEVRFVLDHAGKPGVAAGEWEPWAGWISALAACPNTVCKLSGLVTEAPWEHWTADGLRPYAEHVLAAFGADRVLFGSDWPVCELAGGYGAVCALTEDLLAGCTPTERAAVLGGTARRVYGLDTG